MKPAGLANKFAAKIIRMLWNNVETGDSQHEGKIEELIEK